jgi:hypothetical protein
MPIACAPRRVGVVPRHQLIPCARLPMRFALLLSLLSFAPLAAQDPLPAPATIVETVRGVVFDSLAMEPLEDAIVVAFPGGATGTTDERGRFAVASSEPVRQLTVFHRVLDQTGLGALQVMRTPGDVYIATPGPLTVWQQVCESRRPLGQRAVIVTGTARLADGRTRVAGARVVAQWERPEYATGGPQTRTLDAVTDSLGNYVMCGVEEFVPFAIIATSNEARSAPLGVDADLRPLRRLDLVLGGASETGIVSGVVRSLDGRGIPNVQVTLDGVDDPSTSGDDGSFRFPQVPTGSRMLFLRGIGYTPVAQVIEVLAGNNPRLDVQIDKVVELEGVRITERALIRRERSEFELRKRAGTSRVIDSAVIRRSVNLRAALQMTQGVNVREYRQVGAQGFQVLGRRGCPAYYYLDGMPSNVTDVNFIPPENLAAVEIFVSAALTPPRFVPLGDDCAVVLFWTKAGLRP